MEATKFIVEAIRTDEYQIAIDPVVWDEAALADWSSVFHQVEELEEIAKDLAFTILRMGSGNFYEGYGYVKTFSVSGREIIQYKTSNGAYVALNEEDYCKGIVVHLNKEDDEHEFNIEGPDEM